MRHSKPTSQSARLGAPRHVAGGGVIPDLLSWDKRAWRNIIMHESENRTMIGRVGRDPCKQLRGELHAQKLKLKEQERKLEVQESKTPLNEAEMTAIKRDIEGWKEGIKNTEKKLAALGCK